MFRNHIKRKRHVENLLVAVPQLGVLNLQMNKCCLWSQPREAHEQQLSQTSNTWLTLKRHFVWKFARLWTHSPLCRMERRREEGTQTKKQDDYSTNNATFIKARNVAYSALHRQTANAGGIVVVVSWAATVPQICIRTQKRPVPCWHCASWMPSAIPKELGLHCSAFLAVVYYYTLFIHAPNVFPMGNLAW